MAISFELQLSNFAKNAGEKSDAAVRTVVLEIGARLIARSPVDTGRFRSNWNYSLNAPTAETTEQTGELFVNHLAALPTTGAASATHFLQNNLPYGPALEYGHSKQAPLGIVGLTVLEFNGIVDDAAKRQGGFDSLGALGVQ